MRVCWLESGRIKFLKDKLEAIALIKAMRFWEFTHFWRVQGTSAEELQVKPFGAVLVTWTERAALGRESERAVLK